MANCSTAPPLAASMVTSLGWTTVVFVMDSTAGNNDRGLPLKRERAPLPPQGTKVAAAPLIPELAALGPR